MRGSQGHFCLRWISSWAGSQDQAISCLQMALLHLPGSVTAGGPVATWILLCPQERLPFPSVPSLIRVITLAFPQMLPLTDISVSWKKVIELVSLPRGCLDVYSSCSERRVETRSCEQAWGAVGPPRVSLPPSASTRRLGTVLSQLSPLCWKLPAVFMICCLGNNLFAVLGTWLLHRDFYSVCGVPWLTKHRIMYNSQHSM